jgi:hypothetical protein
MKITAKSFLAVSFVCGNVVFTVFVRPILRLSRNATNETKKVRDESIEEANESAI